MFGKVLEIPQTEKTPFIQEARMEFQKFFLIGLQ